MDPIHAWPRLALHSVYSVADTSPIGQGGRGMGVGGWLHTHTFNTTAPAHH
jgi:hypothetical protein